MLVVSVARQLGLGNSFARLLCCPAQPERAGKGRPGSAKLTKPSHGYRTPRQIYREGLWVCGRSAMPTGCASPASRASSESEEMLAFAHIPTGTTADKRI